MYTRAQSKRKKKKKPRCRSGKQAKTAATGWQQLRVARTEKGKRSLLTNEEQSNASPWGSLELPTKTLGLPAFGRFTPKETKVK